MDLQILQRDSLPLGGFAGLVEHRLVVDKKIGGSGPVWDGIGNFVYLADARFLPGGETRMHPHKEIDVISIMIAGRIEHQGSLEHGRSLIANQAQVQRAGGQGFSHNEINPDNEQNRMLQIWVLPDTAGEPASYRSYDIDRGRLTAIYGGSKDQGITFDSHTIIETGIFDSRQNITREGDFIAYITRGKGMLNDVNVKDGDLVRGQNLNFTATDNDVLLVVMTTE